MSLKKIKKQYYLLLKKHFIKPNEQKLFNVSELGRNLVKAEIPPEEIAELHEEAIMRLGVEFPDVKLLDTVSMISEPLMELLMSYGLAFREQLDERRKVEDELEKHREHLEELVKERTVELEKKNVELERFNKLFIGREFRIKELRDKVKELEKNQLNK